MIIATAFWFRIWTERGDARLPSDEELAPAMGFTPSLLSSDRSPSLLPGEDSAFSAGKVDLNRAPAEIIETLPGIGPKLAGEIVRFREARGAFRGAEDILGVRGIGPKKLSELEPYLFFESDDR